MPRLWRAIGAGATLLAVVAAGAAVAPGADDAEPAAAAGTAPAAATVATPTRPAAPGPAPRTEEPELLRQAGGGDGDSWRDIEGVEYRLGLVNAPEVGDCYGAEATARRRELLRDGFRAHVYTHDRYGRGVAEIATADGRNLAVVLARSGHVDDRFLERFAAENPGLAEQLRPAFEAARRERAGLWGACLATPQEVTPPSGAPPPSATAPAGDTSCHPDYTTCVAVKGNGSGSGAGNDLDCGDIREVVQLRRAGVDPYRVDGNGDGVGCESYR